MFFYSFSLVKFLLNKLVIYAVSLFWLFYYFCRGETLRKRCGKPVPSPSSVSACFSYGVHPGSGNIWTVKGTVVLVNRVFGLKTSSHLLFAISERPRKECYFTKVTQWINSFMEPCSMQHLNFLIDFCRVSVLLTLVCRVNWVHFCNAIMADCFTLHITRPVNLSVVIEEMAI